MTTYTTYNFDERIDRRDSDCGKWNRYDEDVIPMWVADMDFKAAPAVLEAMHERVDHGVFGYGFSSWTHICEDLVAAIQNRYATHFNTPLDAEDILFVPSVVSSIYGLSKFIPGDGDNVLIQVPNYWPFFSAADAAPREIVTTPMVGVRDNGSIRYEIDFEAFEAAITPQTKLFILSNPHNPVGRAYQPGELERMAEICLRHNVLICSDEIHADLVYNGHRHTPIMSLSPEVADQCITLTAASKAFNIAGLGLGIAISKNHDLLGQLNTYFGSLGLGTINIMSNSAMLAAYQHGQPWLDELMVYLEANRDYALDFIQRNMPGVIPTCPEATYLMLLDCSEAGIEGSPVEFFLNEARVALSGGFDTQGYDSLVRLNYGCPRAQLTEALERMARALA